MLSRSWPKRIVVSFGVSMLAGGAASAHDRPGDHTIEEPVERAEDDHAAPSLVEQVTGLRFYESAPPGWESQDLLENQFFGQGSDFEIKSVFDSLKKISLLEEPIKVCFENGQSSRRRITVVAASAWEVAGSGIEFDFGDRDMPRDCEHGDGSWIRISLQGASSWSLIGSDALLPQNLNKTTMTIAWDEIAAADRAAVIKHEFGHALGFLHEHLNPQAECLAELKTDHMKQVLSGPPYNMKPEQIESDFLWNLRGRRVETSEFDHHSIMLYALPSDFFHDPETATCLHPLNLGLSELDKDGAIEQYPSLPTRARIIAQNAFEKLRGLLTDSDLSADERAAALSYAAAFRPSENAGEQEVYQVYASELIENTKARLEYESFKQNE